MPKFWSFIGTILFWYYVDISMYDASNGLELKNEGDET